ncbi:3230e342-3fdc-4a15-9c09-c0bf88d306b1 [Thermothielavioides terrestris]|uniref:3230e342-3fdc-4a15-9c09-c0bf88d306b1 n=1 Tax=Thermothielavioides terrestris TaxID=2587410 RepID=A0A446BT26_9PEZI|nr:3230e342-3fdc-4a15-9c09-c0bf88d306b1 [Thermothielavioides terrestris]
MSAKGISPWSKLRGIFGRAAREKPRTAQEDPDGPRPNPNDYPTFPPLSPRDLLQNRAAQFDRIAARKYGAPQGEYEDKPLYGLYRFYEFVVLDSVTNYRNSLEAFWRRRDWAVRDIPDPQDPDPERYAFLAACTYLMVRAFNARVKLGLDRSMPSLITPDEAEELRRRPDHLRNYERVPEWAEKVPPLQELLVVPTHDGEVLAGREDPRADPDFLAKGILLWTPHIYFT